MLYSDREVLRPTLEIDVSMGAIVGCVCFITALLCIGDAAGVNQLYRSSRYIDVALGAVILFFCLSLWASIALRNDRRAIPLPTNRRVGTPLPLGALIALAMFTSIGIIYSLNLLFTYGSAGAYPYIAIRSIFLDICNLVVILLGSAFAVSIRGSHQPLYDDSYSVVSRDNWDAHSENSWNSSVQAIKSGWSLESRNTASLHLSANPIWRAGNGANNASASASVDSSQRSSVSSRSEDIEELMQSSFGGDIQTPDREENEQVYVQQEQQQQPIGGAVSAEDRYRLATCGLVAPPSSPAVSLSSTADSAHHSSESERNYGVYHTHHSISENSDPLELDSENDIDSSNKSAPAIRAAENEAIGDENFNDNVSMSSSITSYMTVGAHYDALSKPVGI